MFFNHQTRIVKARVERAGTARLCSEVSGAVAIEFALLAPPFLALIFAAIQTALVFFATEVLETTAESASRIILTGQAQLQGMSQSQFASAVCGQIPGLLRCANLMIDVQTASSFSNANTTAPTLTFDSQGQVTNVWQYRPGTPGDVVVLRILYQWPLVYGPLSFNLANLGNGNRLLMATAVFKNEKFQ